MFFGREDILQKLDVLIGKHVASLVTCRGRRRIGKSHWFTLGHCRQSLRPTGISRQ